MVSGYNRGGVTTHAPLGDGSVFSVGEVGETQVTIHAPLGDGSPL